MLIITDLYFPTKDPVLDNVFSRILPTHGYHITWLMLSETITKPSEAKWNQTRICLLPAGTSRGFYAYAREILNWTRLVVFAVLLVRRQKFDIIQVRNSILAGWLAWILAKLSSARLVYHFTFPIPEYLILAAKEGLTRIPSMQIPIGYTQIALRGWLIKHADLVLAQSDEMQRQLLEKGIASERVFSFPLGTECPEEPDSADVSQLRNKLGLNDNPVILYFGMIHPLRRLEFLMRVAGHVKQNFPKAVWLFVGGADVAEVKRLMNAAKENGVENAIVFTGKVKREKMPLFLSLASVSVSPIPPTQLYWGSSPTKTVESLAMGCPVVATNIPDQEFLISKSNGGIISPFEEEAFADAICKILNNSDMAAKMGESGRAFVRQYRSYKFLTNQLDKRYQALLCTET